MAKKSTAIALILVLSMLIWPLPTHAVEHLSAPERDYIIRAVASEYPSVTYAARVGIICVILNRLASPEYPDTAVAVISSMRDNFSFPAAQNTPSSDALRLTRDAFRAAESGARLVGDALSFTVAKTATPGDKIRSRLPLDMQFDNSAEWKRTDALLSELSDCKIIIDSVGFF